MQNLQQMIRILTLAVVGVGVVPAVANAGITGFGNFSNFTINQSDVASPPTLSIPTSTIRLTNQGGSETRSIFNNAPQSISTFTASVTWQAINNSNNSFDSNWGACLVLENDAAGAHALGANYSHLGYSLIQHSVAISLEPNTPTKSGLFTNGSIGGGSPFTSPVDLLSGHPITITLTYNGSVLHENLRDTVTLASYDADSIINIPSIVGSSTAYVGVTATTNNGVDQYFSNFQFAAVPEPSSLALGVVGGAALLACFGRRRRDA